MKIFSHIILFIFLALSISCKSSKSDDSTSESNKTNFYTGTASLSQGAALVSIDNIYDCSRGRKAPIGTSTAIDGSTWTVPAKNNFTNARFPFASDLFNPCTGVTYATAAAAVAALDPSNIIEIDSEGELITGYIFADNYFELYINGTPVGKDNVPFTQFNANLVQFKVNRPFSIAMKLIDWEENSGLGSEANRGSDFHAGDGGMVAVFTDKSGKTIANTGADWKAQTFYTAPIKDLSCPTESGTTRSSADCDTNDSEDGSSYYALHWKVPGNWMDASFDDSAWPSATTYTNETIGVDNKKSYTNFTEIFDNPTDDAEFIWSTNVILDNEVIVRYTVPQ